VSRSIETYTNRNPRLMVFHGIVLALIAVLIGGMAFRQLFTTAIYSERERLQNQRRVIAPAPRGNIYDRHGEVIVGNRPRFSVVLDLANLRGEFRAEYKKVKGNYASLDAADRPNTAQLAQLARAAVAQRYLDQVNKILKRDEKVNSKELNRHIESQLLLPYVLLDDLAPEEYARLLERLDVNSPAQVYTYSRRNYPHGDTAAHTVGYIGVDTDPQVEDFAGDDLLQFKMKGSVGRAGLEKIFDAQLQGTTGAAIYLVDPAGYKINEPLEVRRPRQGDDLHTSLDLELQLAAEKALAGRTGAAVAVDVRTGEVLVLASKPDYSTSTLRPNLAPDVDLERSGVWLNRAIQGQYPPGSTFKLITATSGLRTGAIVPSETKVICPGFYMVAGKRFVCHNPAGHGEVNLAKAISVSCNVFFYKTGLEVGPNLLAAEAHRFGYDDQTGIELPDEFRTPHVASPAWKKEYAKTRPWVDGRWNPGDTANTAIGQGDTLITPLHAACLVASLARGETRTQPTLLHDPNRPRQRTEPIGLSPADYNVMLEGMELCYRVGSASTARVEGLRGAAKTGTAQLAKIELAWVVAFAPVENPQIAVAVVLEGAEGQNFGGGINAGPVVKAILQAWKDQRDRPPAASTPATSANQPASFRLE
jgi:penicillin-binding protein 2